MAVKTKAAKGAAKGYLKTRKTKAKAKGGAKAAKGGVSAAAGAAVAARQSPYVQELVTNEDLRDSIVDAYQSVRTAVDRASSSKQPIAALFDDKKLQKELQNAGESIRDSAVTLREAPDGGSSSGGGLGRKLLLLIVAAGLALAVSEGLRKKVLDALFGAEEEFEYTSTTSGSSSNGPASTATPGTPAAS
jgi:hypothetical protein